MTETIDSRMAAFLSGSAPEVFHPVCHRHEIFVDDPLDVESIHRDARDAFERLLHRAATPPALPSGRILLLKGDAGSGKTHLMRAFRSTTHGSGLGYFGYMQMTTATNHYAEYVLSNLVTSLDQPYQEGGVSGLQRLSSALLEADGVIPEEQRELLREEVNVVGSGLATLVNQLAAQLVKHPRFHKLNLDLIRALLYLQRNDPLLSGRVLAWLRCEELSPHDTALLGGLVPRTKADDPQRTLEELGRTMAAVHDGGGVLVLCVDQLEDMFVMENAKERFQRAMTALCAIADRVPLSIIVISCLADYYQALRNDISVALRDRIERDPAPVHLVAKRSEEEIHDLVRARLRFLYELCDAPFRPKEPLYPFSPEHLKSWANSTARDVLEGCRATRELASRLGKLPDPTDTMAATTSPVPEQITPAIDLIQGWNDHLSSWKKPIPTDPAALATLLSSTIERCTAELETPHVLRAKTLGSDIDVEIVGPDGTVLQQWLTSICNLASQGGGLGHQLDALVATAGKRIPVAVRTTAFPSNPKTQVAKKLGAMLRDGGRRAVIEVSDWRAMAAMDAFRAKHGNDPRFADWLKKDKPLRRLPGLKELLAVDKLPPIPLAEPPRPAPIPAPVVSPAVALAATAAASDAHALGTDAPKTPSQNGLSIGATRGLTSQELFVDPAELTRHAAFLGGTGSGKTTLAMFVLEELLLRGVPAILLDRKGDLCRYGAAGSWTSPARDPEHASRRQRLRDRLDVAVYTPGNPRGRGLAVPLAPKELGAMSEVDRDQALMQSAFALGAMLGYDERRDRSSIAVLKQAMTLLTALKVEITLDRLLEIVGTPPNELIAAMGLIDAKLLRKLGQQLQTLKLTGGPIVDPSGEPMEVDLLLGRGAHASPGRTRLSVISTKFLGDTSNVLFFVSQLLIALSRWTSKNPAPALQAALFTDEADLYLPAMSKPPTKEPMETLLKRARSAGLSVMLATQSPGDLDYRCRDTIRSWFVGQVKEPRALEKMKPMMSEVRGLDVSERIPQQKTGEFHWLRDGQATAFQASRSAIALDQLTEDEILQVAAARR